tara:strand:- start:317 stop:502 length:186 start_codon:yes stop_codon:yes gene_type:complete
MPIYCKELEDILENILKNGKHKIMKAQLNLNYILKKNKKLNSKLKIKKFLGKGFEPLTFGS